SEQQEILFFVADILIDVYSAESAVLRALNAHSRGLAHSDLHLDAVRMFVSDAAGRIGLAARGALAAMCDGVVLDAKLTTIAELVNVTPINTVAIGRRLAEATTAKGGYVFA